MLPIFACDAVTVWLNEPDLILSSMQFAPEISDALDPETKLAGVPLKLFLRKSDPVLLKIMFEWLSITESSIDTSRRGRLLGEAECRDTNLFTNLVTESVSCEPLNAILKPQSGR